MRGRQRDARQTRTVEVALTVSFCPTIAHGPAPAMARAIATAPASPVETTRANLEAAEAHVANEQRVLGGAERREQERDRDHLEQRLDFGLAVEIRDRACEGDSGQREHQAEPDVEPERARTVFLRKRLALHERGAEREIGEDERERREHRRHRHEADLERRQQVRDEDRRDERHHLHGDLGERLPAQSLHDLGAELRRPERLSHARPSIPRRGPGRRARSPPACRPAPSQSPRPRRRSLSPPRANHVRAHGGASQA